MDKQRWERAGGVAGVLAVFLALAGFVVPGLAGMPAHSASAPTFAATLVERGGAITVGGWLLALAGLSLLCFTWSLGSTLRRAEGEPSGMSDVTFAAGALWALLWVLAGQLLQAAVGLADYYQHPHGAKTAVLLSNLPVNESGPLLPALLVGSTALVARHTHIFPHWYARFSVVLAPVLVLSNFAIIDGTPLVLARDHEYLIDANARSSSTKVASSFVVFPLFVAAATWGQTVCPTA